MNNPFDYFDAIYCINLDERTDRWEHCLTQFEKLGISDRVERFSAAKCSSSSERNIIAKQRFGLEGPGSRRFPQPGAVGCSISHLDIIKLAKTRGLENVLVFEDDIKVVKDWEESLGMALVDLDNFDWHLFYLGWTFQWGKKNLIRERGEYLLEHVNHSKRRGVEWTGAISYNSTIFDYLIENINPFNRAKYGKRGHIDRYYRRNSQLNKFLMNPQVIVKCNCLGSNVSIGPKL